MKEIDPSWASFKVFSSKTDLEESPDNSPPKNLAISDNLYFFFGKPNYFFCSLFIRSTTSGVKFILSSVLSKANKA